MIESGIKDSPFFDRGRDLYDFYENLDDKIDFINCFIENNANNPAIPTWFLLILKDAANNLIKDRETGVCIHNIVDKKY